MEKEINENIIEIEGKKYKFIEAEKSICCRSCDLRKDRRCHLLHRMCISDNRKDKKEGYFKIVEDTTMEKEKTIKLTLDQAKEMLKSDNEMLKELAIGAFPELEKPKYPMSYWKLLNSSDRTESDNFALRIDRMKTQLIDGIYISSWLSKEQEKEVVAFIKLLALVKEWNKIDEFVPDWSDNKFAKSIIINLEGKVLCGFSRVQVTPLVFKDDKTAVLFRDTFRDLIEQCKNLI